MTSKFPMLLAFSLLFAAGNAKEAAEADRDNLQGRWEMISDGYYDGEEEPRSVRRLIIAGDTFCFEEDGQVLSRGTFKLAPYQNPKAIDVEVTESRIASSRMKYLGIYKLDGDTLTWCWAELGSAYRPTDFIADVSHPRHNVLTFKREKR